MPCDPRYLLFAQCRDPSRPMRANREQRERTNNENTRMLCPSSDSDDSPLNKYSLGHSLVRTNAKPLEDRCMSIRSFLLRATSATLIVLSPGLRSTNQSVLQIPVIQTAYIDKAVFKLCRERLLHTMDKFTRAFLFHSSLYFCSEQG